MLLPLLVDSSVEFGEGGFKSNIVLNTDLAGPSFFLPMRNGPPYILLRRSGIWSIVVGVASGGSTLLGRERAKEELDLVLSLVLRI